MPGIGSCGIAMHHSADEDQRVTVLYRHPPRLVRLSVEPRLASWDRAGTPGQVRLVRFPAHAEARAAPMMAAVDGPLSVELAVGLPGELSLTGGGRDLDNDLLPLAQRLGPARIAAMFGRKVHGPSFLAIGRAEPDPVAVPPQFSAQISGSYERKQWKSALRHRSAASGPCRPGHQHHDRSRPELGQHLETAHRRLWPCSRRRS